MLKIAITVLLFASALADTTCPDERQQCDGHHTCCHLAVTIAGSDWGCCPFENGVCCLDGLTCCPADHNCVPGKHACVPNDRSLSTPGEKAFLQKSVRKDEIGARSRMRHFGHVQENVNRFEMPSVTADRDDVSNLFTNLPASKQSKASTNCGSDETPCNSTLCCPLPNGICCANGRHCCPSLTTCDLTRARCVAGVGQNEVLLPLYVQSSTDQTAPMTIVDSKKDKLPATTPVTASIVCPDKQSQCPDGTTCCQLSSGQYGCCPQPNAVCCEDKLHCCPENTKCDVVHSRCIQSDGKAYAWYTKEAASTATKDVICPDKQSTCPDGSTCCLLENGQYGCCPLPNAVCCEDKEHCCPEKSTCDVVHSRCIQSDGTSSAWYEKKTAK